MRISGWRVDGFGVLADQRVEELPAGLTVVVGPNEAGKSTLLDFLRGVLFGFPDRRHRRPYHEPLRGGSHGGAVSLLDASGGGWLLERHVGGGPPALSGPDGALRGEAELRRLLGGVDGEVFRSVYAFGLSELSSLETLERDEVRDLIFSAGILGAGRSATRAQHSLASRQAALVRPRRSDAVANLLRRRLDAVDGELRRLREEARRFPERAEECEGLAARVREEEDTAEELRQRLRELDRLEAAWPDWCERRSAEAELAALAAPDPAEATLLARSAEIAALRDRRAGFEEWARQRDDLARQLDAIQQRVEDALRELGPGARAEVVRHLDLGIATAERAERLSRRHGELLAELRSKEEVADRDSAEVGRLEGALSAQEKAAGRVRSKADLDAAGELLHEARRLLDRREELEQDRARAEQQARLEALASRRAGVRLAGSWALAALLVASALLASGAALSVTGGHGATAALFAAAALVVSAVAVASAAQGRLKDRAGGAGPEVPEDGDRAQLRQVEARLAELARSFRRPGRLERGDLDPIGRALDSEVASRLALDDLARRLADARRRREESLALADRCRDQLAENDRAAATLGSELLLPPSLGPDSLGRAVDLLARLRKDLDALDRVGQALSKVDARLESYAHSALSLASALAPAGLEGGSFVLGRQDESEPLGTGSVGPAAAGSVGTGSAAGTERKATAPEQALVAVGHLVERLEATASAREARGQLEDAACRARDAVDRALGGGSCTGRLLAELASGDPVAWQAERRMLADRLGEVKQRHDEATRAHERSSQALGQLLGSTRLAELELEGESLRAELRAALERYAVLGIARTLLERTLARYERERQPEVVRRAAELFASATRGRYVRLVSRPDADGRSHGIDAIDEWGARVDAGSLSRGTAEQLYLCLRLALATAGGAGVELPLVLDDVLVNFDPDRAAAVAEVIADVARQRQVLAFTCHPHVAELLSDASPKARVLELPGTSRAR